MGPVEQARLALVLGGVPFDDARFDRDSFLAKKAAGELPYGQLPTMEVDGKTVAQSAAIAHYCANVAGLTPSDPLEQAKVMEVYEFIVQDIRERLLIPTMRIKDPAEKAEARATIAKETLPAKLALLEKQVQPSGYLVGDSVTLADIQFYCTANWIGLGVLDGIPKDVILQFPKLTKLIQTLNEHPKIKAWNAEKNPKLPWC